MDWMLMPYRRYADFSGRSQRQEFWMFELLIFILYVVYMILISLFASAPTVDPATGEISGGGGMMATVVSGLFGLFWLGTIIPAIAVAVRRMHDQDRSGWWILVPIANIIFYCMDGTPGPNRFGPDPKGRGA